MAQNVVLTLLQVVALALPAVGIYLQVLRNIHKPGPRDEYAPDYTNDMMDFNLAKSSLLIISFSGVINISYLIIIHSPTLWPEIGQIVLQLLLIASMLLIGFGLFLFVGSVYLSFGMSVRICSNPSMRITIYSFIKILYNRVHPKKSYKPDGD